MSLAEKVTEFVAAALGKGNPDEQPEVPALAAPDASLVAPPEAEPPVVMLDMGLRVTTSGNQRRAELFDGDGNAIDAANIVKLTHACCDTIAGMDSMPGPLRGICRKFGDWMAEQRKMAVSSAVMKMREGHKPLCARRQWANSVRADGMADGPPPECDCGGAEAKPDTVALIKP